ncbi:MAG: hypothetical protein EBQ99_09755 [Planctomycetes bacterium]|nr:hypothetical protein [Planctomycetota bacterium]
MHARRPRVLFLCTGNACRSQMAEGWARTLHGALIEAHSAGTQPHDRRVRDEIRAFIAGLPKRLDQAACEGRGGAEGRA